MASIRKEPNGSYRILIICPDGRRRSIKLDKDGKRRGDSGKAAAETVKSHLEHIVAQLNANQPICKATGEWIRGTTAVMRRRLASAGIIQFEETNRVTLGDFLESYFKGREVKASTKTFYEHTRKRLDEFFKSDTALEDIDAMKARSFREWLVTSNKRNKPIKPKKERENAKNAKPVPVDLAQNTIRRRMGLCRQIFGQAVQDGKIQRNPFAGMSTTVKANKEREHYIPLDVFDKVMAHLSTAGQRPTAWQAYRRALFVLARIGAFRIPSEAQGLKWEHIAWEADPPTVSVVMSSKTEHHENRAVRRVPLLPEIETALMDLWAHAEEGAEYVFPGISGDTNLRTGLERILCAAGVEQWPKLWQNLRSSGATDFASEYPAHVAAAICGHSVEVARAFYWRATDSDLRETLDIGKRVRARCAQSVAKSAQNTPTKEDSNGGQARPENSEDIKENAVFAGENSKTEWAKRDSNPRHLLCKSSALTN